MRANQAGERHGASNGEGEKGKGTVRGLTPCAWFNPGGSEFFGFVFSGISFHPFGRTKKDILALW